MNTSRPNLPIPSFHYPDLDRIDNNSSTLSISDLDDRDEEDDDMRSLQTQYEEGAYEEEAWNNNTFGCCANKAKRSQPVASANITRISRRETESSNNEVDNLDLVLEEASPSPHYATPTSNESSSQEEEEEEEEENQPLFDFKRVTRSTTRRLAATRRLARLYHQASILTDEEEEEDESSSSSVATPPPSSLRKNNDTHHHHHAPAAASSVITPPRQQRSNEGSSNSSASLGTDVDVTDDDRCKHRKRNNKRPGSKASPAVSKTKKRKKTKSKLKHTTDLDGKTAETFAIPVHTLILGTHPSTKSLEAEKYYANPMNAFWWIVGDCFGFRRAKGVTTKGVPYKFASELRFHNIIPYEMQLQRLCCKGFALKNTFQSCSRRGSSIGNIKSGVPNDIRKWCQDRPSIRRIVFSNGKSSFDQFAKHFQYWLESGELVPCPHHKASQEAFAKYRTNNATHPPPPDRTIECIIAVAVSPALATYTYAQKREFWETNVFEPGLQDFEAWEKAAIASSG